MFWSDFYSLLQKVSCLAVMSQKASWCMRPPQQALIKKQNSDKSMGLSWFLEIVDLDVGCDIEKKSALELLFFCLCG